MLIPCLASNNLLTNAAISLAIVRCRFLWLNIWRKRLGLCTRNVFLTSYVLIPTPPAYVFFADVAIGLATSSRDLAPVFIALHMCVIHIRIRSDEPAWLTDHQVVY